MYSGSSWIKNLVASRDATKLAASPPISSSVAKVRVNVIQII
jgi:hypothetical protein